MPPLVKNHRRDEEKNVVIKRCIACNVKGRQVGLYCTVDHPDYIMPSTGCSKISCKFLDELESEFGIKIQHMHYEKKKKEEEDENEKDEDEEEEDEEEEKKGKRIIRDQSIEFLVPTGELTDTSKRRKW